jgi:hypothetical protein
MKRIRIDNTESGLILVGGDPVDERVLLPGPADLLPHLSAERLPRRQLEQEAGGIQHLQARHRETNTPMRKVLWIRKYFFQIRICGPVILTYGSGSRRLIDYGSIRFLPGHFCDQCKKYVVQ